MPILRVVTDIQVDREPTQSEVTKITEMTLEFANGVVPATVLTMADKGSKSEAHLHVSNPDYACAFCREHSIDLLPR